MDTSVRRNLCRHPSAANHPRRLASLALYGGVQSARPHSHGKGAGGPETESCRIRAKSAGPSASEGDQTVACGRDHPRLHKNGGTAAEGVGGDRTISAWLRSRRRPDAVKFFTLRNNFGALSSMQLRNEQNVEQQRLNLLLWLVLKDVEVRNGTGRESALFNRRRGLGAAGVGADKRDRDKCGATQRPHETHGLLQRSVES